MTGAIGRLRGGWRPRDPHLVRRLTYGVAGVATVLSMLAALDSALDMGESDSRFVVLVVPVAVLASLPWREWRSAVLAVGAGVLAVWVPDAELLWPALAALVFVSVAEDLREMPWLGWAAGIAGSTVSMLLFEFQSDLVPFLATFFGGGLGLLLRSWMRIAGEAQELRGQAAWLEQRTAVARELHDVVGHHVTAMVVQAEAGRVGDADAALAAIADLGRTALGELDSLVVHLRDPGAPLTVSAPPRLLDIDELLAEPLRRAGLAVDVQLGDDLELTEPDVLTVYRIAQEALTNVARHAKASRAWVEVSRDGDTVRLRVSDDGSGPPAERRRGSGLLGIEERLAGRGGGMELATRPGGGSMLDVRLPVDRS